MNHAILLQNGLIEIPGEPVSEVLTLGSLAGSESTQVIEVATVMGNLAKYGFTLDQEALACLAGVEDRASWWPPIDVALRSITGADRNMDSYVVYKNFPREVLSMDRATYVWQQLAMYWGVPADEYAQKPNPRAPLGNMKRLRVLKLAPSDACDRILADLISLPTRWNDNQAVWASELFQARDAVVASDFKFRENALLLAATRFADIEFCAASATDVLKLTYAMSGAKDLSLRTKCKLRRFKRAERRRLLGYLDEQKNLTDDIAQRREPFKRLFEHLRPGDYASRFPAVVAAYDALYKGEIKTLDARLSPRLITEDTIAAATQYPGILLRRFRHYYSHLPTQAVASLLTVLDKVSTRKLVAFAAYLRTVNERATMMYAPRGNWAKVQVCPNKGVRIAATDIQKLTAKIGYILGLRLDAAYPAGFKLDLRVDDVKLQTNDQKLAEYGRGSEFDIPPEMTFLRSASYWKMDPKLGTTWFDNGWNFFDEHWQPLGVCSWDTGSFPNTGYGYWLRRNDDPNGMAAVFSGDPVNSKELAGRACQMIDLYLDRLKTHGVRYAVWGVLCYSGKKFSEAEDVLATFQWGENAEEGKLYEPARAQMVFPLKSETLSSYVAYIDLARRKLVYMDAPLPTKVGSASRNGEILQEMMPAYIEYLASLPTVLELAQDAKSGTIPLLYDDEAVAVQGGPAYVFRPLNAQSSYKAITLAELMAV